MIRETNFFSIPNIILFFARDQFVLVMKKDPEGPFFNETISLKAQRPAPARAWFSRL